MSEYQYTPLDATTEEIRILELHPGSFDDPITISITTTPFVVPEPEPSDEDRLERIRERLPSGWEAYETLEGRILFRGPDTETTWDHPDPHYDRHDYEYGNPSIKMSQLKYEALSYTWGSDNNQATIHVICQLRFSCSRENTTLTVRENLHNALKHLRNEADSRTLWIDAICINQKDPGERNRQVSRMRDIYTHARRVVVWLGLESSTATLAMRTLGHIGNQIEYSTEHSCVHAPDCTEKDLHEVNDATEIDSDLSTWSAVYQLLLRSWFNRLWVKQEVQLANATALVQCGTFTMTWGQLRRAVLFFGNIRFPAGTPSDLSLLFRVLAALVFGFKNVSPVDVLMSAVFAECSDPRDKVYGVLGLLPPALAQHIKPRYDRSKLVVYRDTFRAYVQCSGSLDILILSGPSWRPDWSIKRSVLRYKGNFSSGLSTANICSFGSGEMMVTGLVHDTVADIAGPLPADDQMILEEVWNIWLKDATPGQTYPTGELLAAACAWTLNTGILQDRFPVYANLEYLADAQHPFERLEQNRGSIPGLDVRLHKTEICKDSYLFRTSKGYFGFSPIRVMPGDKVGVLLGCPFPVLLRKQLSGQHLFIACVYVHGLMDGEALLGPLPEGCKVFLDSDRNGVYRQVFVNSTTQARTRDDPRLGPLPAEWEEVETRDCLWPTKKVDGFRNKDTGQVMHSDPRMLPDALRARGVPLKTITLL